ncbi:MAG TPA: hypothetical protein VLI54_04990 [Bacillota bacterium]|nr:hypothetical protein [Bacillota bacterium]
MQKTINTNTPTEVAPNNPANTSTNQVVVGGAPRNTKKILLLLLCALLLVGGGVFAWLHFFSAPKTVHPNSTSSTASGTDFHIAPRFNEVEGYASLHGAAWYAVDGGVIRIKKGSKPVYYSQREGVPAGVPTSLVAYKDTLWLGTQNGVATLKPDESGFSSAAGMSFDNGELYHDTFANKLYLLTFDNFYVYNDATKGWDSTPGAPKAISSFTANKDFLVGAVNGSGMPVWIYNKSTAKWSMHKASGIDDDTPQSVFTLGNEVFTIGRSTGYTSCEQAGKITATSAYRLDSSGAWQPQTSFNADIARPELTLAKHVKDTSTVLYTSACDADTHQTTYKVTYEDGALKLNKTGTITNQVFSGDDGEQQAIVDELSKATGLYPYIKVVTADAKGNLIFSYNKTADRSSTPRTAGMAIAKGTDFAHSTTIQVADSKTYDVQTPVICDGKLSYLFVGTYGHEPREGFDDGSWTKTLLLKVTGSTTETFADLQNNVGPANFSCGAGKINWVGTRTVRQLDIATKATIDAATGLDATNAQQTQAVYPLDSGDMWLLMPVNSTKEATTAKLYYFTSSSKNLKNIGTYTAVALLGGTTNNAWIAEHLGGDGNDRFTGLAVYDLQGHKTSKDAAFMRLGVQSDKQALLLQPDNPTNSIFINFKGVSYALGGGDAAIPAAHVPLRQIRLNQLPDAFAIDSNSGIYDTTHHRMWFADDQLGSFAIDL